MGDLALFIALPVVALLLPGLFAGWLTARAGRMRPAKWLAAVFAAAGFGLFAHATRYGQTTTQSLPGVLISSFLLLPAALAALIGGAIGRAVARRRTP